MTFKEKKSANGQKLKYIYKIYNIYFCPLAVFYINMYKHIYKHTHFFLTDVAIPKEVSALQTNRVK